MPGTPEVASQGDEPSPDVLGRRRFLTRAAVGTAAAGVAFAAPSILTLDQAAACHLTCPRTILDWNVQWGNNGAGTPTTVGGVTVTITPTDPGGQGVAPNFVVQTATFGGLAGYYQLRQTANATANEIVTFTFTNAATGAAQQVSDLCFTLLDVDRLSNGWQDRVWLTSVPAAATRTFTLGGGASPPGPSGAGTAASPWLGVGANNIPDNSMNGNITVGFTSPVSAFTINYRNGNTTGSIQRIGVYDLSWCTIAGFAGAASLSNDTENGARVAPPAPPQHPKGVD